MCNASNLNERLDIGNQRKRMVSHMRMYASLPSTSSSDTLVISSSLYLNQGDFFISEEDSFLPPCFLRCKPDSDSDSASATLSGMPRQYLQWSGC